MNEILKMLNELKADELDGLIVRANILLEKKRKEEAEQALLEKERLRQKKTSRKSDASRKSRCFSANCRSCRVSSRRFRNRLKEMASSCTNGLFPFSLSQPLSRSPHPCSPRLRRHIVRIAGGRTWRTACFAQTVVSE